MAADSEVSLRPAPPALSLSPALPLPPPALSAHRLSCSLPAARVRGVRDHGLHHRLRMGEVGAAAPLAGWRGALPSPARPGRSCRAQPLPLARTSGAPFPGAPFPGALSRLSRVKLRPRLKRLYRAVSELSERSVLIPVCKGLEYTFRRLMCFLSSCLIVKTVISQLKPLKVSRTRHEEILGEERSCIVNALSFKCFFQ